MKKKYFQEYKSLEDLLKQSEHYIYCTPYKDEYVYFVGQITYPDVSLLSFYRSKEKYTGWIGLDITGKIILSKVPKKLYIPIVELEYSNFVEDMLVFYNARKGKKIK